MFVMIPTALHVHALGRHVVVVSSEKLFKEVLLTKSMEFAGRHDPKRMAIINNFHESSFTSDYSAR